jgi:putative ABC transport system permease protein
MFKNYLLIAVRNLSKNVGYTSINVFGLAIGLACCLLVTLYIRFETSFENFHENKASLYRYISRSEKDGSVYMQTNLPSGFGPLIGSSIREVEMFSRVSDLDSRPLLLLNEKVLDAKPMAIVDADFFKMFSFELVEGNSTEVLKRPFTIAIAQSVADKYFPKGDVIGKSYPI